MPSSEKEINNQKNKLERIKKAYINGDFELKEYNEEKKIVENAITELENKLDTTDCVEELKFTPRDILLKRDIELDIIGTVIAVKQINFRESICKPCQELFDKGYIDTTKPMILANVLGSVRFSNYLPEEEVGEIIMRLQKYYDVHFTETTYYVQKQMFYFNFVEDNNAIVRVFPLEDYYKLDPDNKMETYKFGIIYINEEDKFQMQEVDTAFDYIPDESNDSIIYTKDNTPISVSVKPVLFDEENANKQTKKLDNTSKDISQILDNLKLPLLDKNNKLILNENIDNIKNYIENVTDVTQTVRSVNDLNVAIKDFEFYTLEVGQEKLMIMTKVTKLLVMIYIKMGYLMITIMK